MAEIRYELETHKVGPWEEWLKTLEEWERQQVLHLAQQILPNLVTPEHTRYAQTSDAAVICTALRIAAGFLRMAGGMKGPLPSEMPQGSTGTGNLKPPGPLP